MFKRLFWVSIGVGIGVVAVTKAQAYVKANTPDTVWKGSGLQQQRSSPPHAHF